MESWNSADPEIKWTEFPDFSIASPFTSGKKGPSTLLVYDHYIPIFLLKGGHRTEGMKADVHAQNKPSLCSFSNH